MKYVTILITTGLCCAGFVIYNHLSPTEKPRIRKYAVATIVDVITSAALSDNISKTDSRVNFDERLLIELYSKGYVGIGYKNLLDPFVQGNYEFLVDTDGDGLIKLSNRMLVAPACLVQKRPYPKIIFIFQKIELSSYAFDGSLKIAWSEYSGDFSER